MDAMRRKQFNKQYTMKGGNFRDPSFHFLISECT